VPGDPLAAAAGSGIFAAQQQLLRLMEQGRLSPEDYTSITAVLLRQAPLADPDVSLVIPPIPPPPGAEAEAAPEEGQFAAMGDVAEEWVTKKTYNWDTKSWESATVTVQLDLGTTVGEGGLRICCPMVDWSDPTTPRQCVAKYIKAKRWQGEAQLYTDAEMHGVCQVLATAFNRHNPPKRVHFLSAWLIQRHGDHPPHLKLLHCEPYVDPTHYVKYNSNFGWVHPTYRATPQAFSHFSWVHTKNKLMVVDLQGVGDLYTDPQIHSSNGLGFGQGNTGQAGIDGFLATHQCNGVCKALGLPTVGGPSLLPPSGTLWNHDAPSHRPLFHTSQFLHDLKPLPKEALPEELALLGMTARQFDNLGACWAAYDRGRTGRLDASSTVLLLSSLQFPFSAEGIQKLVTTDGDGTVTFKTFLLWWMGLD